MIFGPVNYGWQGYLRLQNAADHGNRDFLDFYLAADGGGGSRPPAVAWSTCWTCTGIRRRAAVCVANPMDGCRVTEDNTDAGVVAARKQAPRSLWDPGYSENSWIAQSTAGNGPIRLLPRLKDKIAANYPGTRLAITEYNYGAGESHLRRPSRRPTCSASSAAKELFAATLWRADVEQQLHLRRLRDLPQLRRRERQLRQHQHPRHQQRCGQYFGVRQRGRGQRRAHGARGINKNDAAQTAGIAVTHAVQFHTAQVYQLTSANSGAAAPSRTSTSR